MARDKDTRPDSSEDTGGTLADAINAHLALKREHGADPTELEQERKEALAPARRDTGDSADLHPAVAAPVNPEPSPPPAPPEPPAPKAVAEPPAPEPAVEPRSTEPIAPDALPEPVAEPVADVAVEPEPEPEPQTEPELTTGYREDTGTIEFEWGGEESPPEPEPEPEQAPPAQPADPDVLEQTPEFFEETPEYDKLWFEERSPREFDF